MHRAELKPNVIVICGPTGTGKTATAIELATRFNGQIISADSMQIYRHMDIGTAKPTPWEQGQIPQHMIDIVDPDEPFNAARFAEIAARLIFEFQSNNVTPFVVGGTGLYIRALVQGLFKTEPIDPVIRMRLKNEAAAHGISFLYERLRRYDADTAHKIHSHDTYRIIRALEVYESAGKPISQFQHEHRFTGRSFTVLKIGLDMDRAELYARINQRVDDMIAAGLLEEVKRLVDREYAPTIKSMQAIGYRHLVAFIQGRLPWEETLRTFKRDTRRYAKRQLTWFKADTEIKWVPAGKIEAMFQLIDRFLNPDSLNRLDINALKKDMG